MLKNLIILGLFAGFSLSLAKTGLTVNEKSTLIYSDSNGKSVIGTLKFGENIYLLEMGEIRSKIKTRSGITGWVKNTSTEFAEIETGRDYIMEERDVSFLDAPLRNRPLADSVPA